MIKTFIGCMCYVYCVCIHCCILHCSTKCFLFTSIHLATGWTVQRARFSSPAQTGHGAHPMGTGSLARGQRGPGVALTTKPPPPPHLAPKLSNSIAITLFPLWDFKACSRVNFPHSLHSNVWMEIWTWELFDTYLLALQHHPPPIFDTMESLYLKDCC
jgi:hypothetical protein